MLEKDNKLNSSGLAYEWRRRSCHGVANLAVSFEALASKMNADDLIVIAVDTCAWTVLRGKCALGSLQHLDRTLSGALADLPSPQVSPSREDSKTDTNPAI